MIESRVMRGRESSAETERRSEKTYRPRSHRRATGDRSTRGETWEAVSLNWAEVYGE